MSEEAIFLQLLHHSCCEDATRYLCPPTQDVGNPFVDGRPCDRPMIVGRNTWTFDAGDGGYAITIRFCPFCGEELSDGATNLQPRR